ncbi:hypothetical protein ElP_25230 [Tautonia plasticadhaerens]|uniref:Uncharacterized protein n=1 Tax=Tautonia plasticadhaerens TaxID=2527974 RepID=A0A518H0S9_9BACT|nr:hypothetical protein ElP_23260 [Tautonia plasticadhaerens]QDV34632.1 hypothetical protein ElP_25230 [Tautonia plasticadhaerens]
MSLPELPPEQAAEAERIYQALRAAGDAELRRIAHPLASKPDGQLLGETEFEVRDRVHRIGAKAIETALNGRKGGGTGAPASAARPAAARASPRAAATRPSSA